MLDYGSSDGHSNRIRFADDNTLDNADWYVVAFFFELLAACASQRFFGGKGTNTSTEDGWYHSMSASETFLARHINGGSATDSLASATPLTVDGLVHGIVLAHDDAQSFMRFYLDGVLDIERALTSEIGANANGLRYGSSAAGVGVACRMGQIMVWAGLGASAFSRDDLDALAALHYAGQTVPRPDLLKYWVKGDNATTTINEITGEVATEDGTVTLSAKAQDAYFQPLTEQFRLIASHRLLRRRTEEPIVQISVPNYVGAALELMDLVNVAHESLPASATKLSGIADHGLVNNWRRYIARVVGIEPVPMEQIYKLTLKDHEASMASFWSTDQLPTGTNQQYEGLARLDLGAQRVTTRASVAYLEQANDVAYVLQNGEDGNYFRSVAVGLEKMNHLGSLAEESTQNPVLNSIAISGQTSWTEVENGGTIGLGQTQLAFPVALTFQNFSIQRPDNANDTYQHQTVAVLTANAYARVYLTYSDFSDDFQSAWFLQRSTDSFYWNNATPGWQSGLVWNALTNNHDGTLERIARFISEPVNIAADENWTLAYGLDSALLPAGGGVTHLYSASILKGRLRFSEVPTAAAAVTTAKDTVRFVRTALPQCVSALRGTLTLTVEAIQSSADLQDGEELCLFYWQYADADNYDAVLYEKQSAENARFSFIRVIGGVLDADAFLEVALAPGDIKTIRAIWTDETSSELDESPRLMRIYVDEVQGTDDTASNNHDAAEVDTEIWKGCAPDSTGYLRAMNYIRQIRVWPRVFTAEETPTS